MEYLEKVAVEKTTLLKLFNELISPTSGVITYEGKDLKDLSPIELRREVVMLPKIRSSTQEQFKRIYSSA